MAEDLHGHGAPSGAPVPRRRVLRAPLKVTGHLKVWIVSANVQSVHAHWTGRRNALCRIDRGEATCQHCADQLPRRLAHWLTVQDIQVSRPPALLCLTPGCVRGCPQIMSRAGFLYGMGLAVWRRPAEAKGAMYAQLHNVLCAKVLWDAPDTWQTLLDMDDAQLRAEYVPKPRLHQPPPPVDPLTEGL